MSTPKFHFILLTIVLTVSQKALSQGFSEIAIESGIQHHSYDPILAGTGLAFVDIDNDGDEDLYLIGGMSSDKLFENDGNGQFKDITVKAGLSFTANVITRAVIAGDVDNDGDRELFITTSEGFSNILLDNNGDKTFTDITQFAGLTDSLWAMGASFGDYNQDGLLDLYVGNYYNNQGDHFYVIRGEAHENQLYRNLGGKKFEDVSMEFPFREEGATLVSAFTDVDGDRDLDLFVGNDLGIYYTPNYLYTYENENFENIAKPAEVDVRMYAMGIGIGDYDKDGDFDYYITNYGDNLFHVKRKDVIKYDDRAKDKQITLNPTTSWGTVFFDYDNDTYLDLAVANGTFLENTYEPTILFRGNADATFQDVSESQNIIGNTSGRGLVTADIDNDGDLDFAVAATYHENESENIRFLLYRNDNINNNNWLKVKLQGNIQSNKDGLGAWVKVVANGETLLREIDGGGASYLSHNSIIAHFGLGKTMVIDSLVVDWIGGGQQVFTGVSTNQFVTIMEDQPDNEIIKTKLCEFDTLLIGGQYVYETGDYYDTIRNANYDLHQIIQTSITVVPVQKDTIQKIMDPGSLFQGHNIQQDTIFIELITDETTACHKALVYNVKLAIVAGTGHSAKSQILNAFPNPAREYVDLKIDWVNQSDNKLYLFDSSGKLVDGTRFRTEKNNGYYRVHIRSLPDGIYFGNIIKEEDVKSFRIIKY